MQFSKFCINHLLVFILITLLTLLRSHFFPLDHRYHLPQGGWCVLFMITDLLLSVSLSVSLSISSPQPYLLLHPSSHLPLPDNFTLPSQSLFHHFAYGYHNLPSRPPHPVNQVMETEIITKHPSHLCFLLDNQHDVCSSPINVYREGFPMSSVTFLPDRDSSARLTRTTHGS